MDMKTLEQHHNALQIMFNLLIHSLTETSPQAVNGWLQRLHQVLETEPGIQGKQREIMTRTLALVAEEMANMEGPEPPLH